MCVGGRGEWGEERGDGGGGVGECVRGGRGGWGGGAHSRGRRGGLEDVQHNLVVAVATVFFFARGIHRENKKVNKVKKRA